MFGVGLVVGKFAPLTLGHINLINTAITMCKRVIVVVSHHDEWLKQQSPRDQKILTLTNRMRWVNEIYGDMENVIVESIDESDIPQYPDGWEQYANILRDSFGHLHDVAIISSELEYDSQYRKLLPEFQHVVVDVNRTRVPISATKIRENLWENWSFLPSVVRKDYAKKVVLLGVESCGKTTLTKMLAKLYNTSWVEEYGRTYCVNNLRGREDLLMSIDYERIVHRQKELEDEALRTANRVMFCDTNAFITQYYHMLYCGRPNNVVQAVAQAEEYDLVLILEPTVAWVSDGLRMSPDRVRTKKLFDDMSKEFPRLFDPKKTHVISSADYHERMEQAITVIDQFLSEVQKGNI